MLQFITNSCILNLRFVFIIILLNILFWGTHTRIFWTVITKTTFQLGKITYKWFANSIIIDLDCSNGEKCIKFAFTDLSEYLPKSNTKSLTDVYHKNKFKFKYWLQRHLTYSFPARKYIIFLSYYYFINLEK